MVLAVPMSWGRVQEHVPLFHKFLEPQGVFRQTLRFEAKAPAQVVAIGQGVTPMGVYVFNAEGNCIAWEDQVPPLRCDDLAIEWIPQDEGPYQVEVHNLGYLPNRVEISIP